MTGRTNGVKDFARAHPYVAFGALMLPVTYATTGDPVMAAFVGGAVAFGPEIAKGLNELQDEEGDDDE